MVKPHRPCIRSTPHPPVSAHPAKSLRWEERDRPYLTDEETEAQFPAAPQQGSGEGALQGPPALPGRSDPCPATCHCNPLLQKGQGFVLTGVLAQVRGRETSVGKERNLLMHLAGSGGERAASRAVAGLGLFWVYKARPLV